MPLNPRFKVLFLRAILAHLVQPPMAVPTPPPPPGKQQERKNSKKEEEKTTYILFHIIF